MDKIKMIICDLDGTLLNNDELVSKKTREVLIKAKEKGYLFALASGRPICSIESLMGIWGLDKNIVDVVIGLNGGHIRDYRLDKEEYNFQIDGYLIEKVVKHFEGYPVNFGMYRDNYLAVYKDDDLANRLAKSDNISYKVVDFEELYKEKQSKFIVICDPADMSMVKQQGDKFIHPDLKSLQAGKIEYEYMHPKLSKSFSIDHVCHWHNLTQGNIIAFGDADNDADMIRDAGIGVAMDNASSLTKSVSNYITLSNEEHGVADYIEKKLL